MEMFWFTVVFIPIFCHVKADLIAVNSQNFTDTFLDSELKLVEETVGVIVLADPLDGCFDMTGPPASLNSSIPCFVLIAGGACSIEDKVMQASKANFSAAVIYNALIKGNYMWDSRVVSLYNITSVVISIMSAESIIDNYLYTVDPGARVLITMNHLSFLSILILLAIAAAVLISLMFLFMLIKCIQRRRQQNRSRLPSRYLNQLPTVKYKSGDPYDMCAICLEEYKDKDRLRILPCSHAYHCKCIDPWLTNNKRTCPVCKQKVRLANLHDDDSDSDTGNLPDTAPLIRSTQRQVNHGTFNEVMIAQPRQITEEVTSRDAPDENVLRLSSSAPGTMSGSVNRPNDSARSSRAFLVHQDIDGTSQVHGSSSSPRGDLTYII